MQKGVTTAPRPSIGRIVIYRQAGPTEEFPTDTVVDIPAIVRGVNEDGTVNLYVFDEEVPNPDAVVDAGATPDDQPAPGTWHWPPRV